MRWKVRLEGGPYDGDSGNWDYEFLPESLYIFRCPDCGDTHWTSELAEAGDLATERYVHDRREDIKGGVVEVYVYGKLDLDHLPLIRECILDPA